MNSTEVATIFLDNDLRVKRFTSETKRVSNLIALDVGRPLSDIASKLVCADMLEDAQLVLQTLAMREREVQSTDGSWFLMRILPYRTAKNRIDGLVLTFVDISKMKEAEQVVLASRDIAGSIMETVRHPLLMLDDRLRVVSANQAFCRRFQVASRDVEQQSLSNLSGGSWNIPELQTRLEESLREGASFTDFILDQTFPHIGRTVFVLNGRPLAQVGAQPGCVLLAMEEMKSELSVTGATRTQVSLNPIP